MTLRTRLAAVAGGIALTLSLAACGNGETAPEEPAAGTAAEETTDSTSPTEAEDVHNDADTMFAQMMIVHHEGAIEMADLAEGRTDNPDILDLAQRIKQAQGPEIDQLNGWLDAWGVNNDMPGMDHGDMGHEMPGMGAEDMKKLEQANGAEFDRLFLELMIEHHQGAVDMSETVLDEGSNPEVKELAQQIIDAQEAEINEMRSLLEG